MKRGILVLLCLCLVLIGATGVFLFYDDNAGKDSTDTVAYDQYDISGTALGSGSEPDLSYSPEKMKKYFTKLTSAIVDIFENKDEKRGTTIDIKNRIEVSQNTYTIGYNNTYVFSGDGRIVINDGSILRLGDSFTIKGDEATIELKKGSTLHVFGTDIQMPIDLNIIIKGSLIQYFEVTGDLAGTSLNMNVKGKLDLDGVLSIGVLQLKGGSGSEFEADVDLGIHVDASSAITDIKNIAQHIFDSDVGVDIAVGINLLRSSISSFLLTYSIDVDSFKSTVSSPIGSTSLVLRSLDINSFVATMTNYLSDVNKVQIDLHKISSTEEGGFLAVDIPNAVFKVETLAKTLYDIEIWMAKFDVEINDRISLTMHSGQLATNNGRFEADLDVREGCSVRFSNTDVYGELTAIDASTLQGLLNLPFRTASHAVIGDLIDASFADNEEASLSLNLYMNEATIYPDEGYRLLEFQSDRYVEYTVEGSGLDAEPKSLKGTYHAELGTREYDLWIGEDIFQYPATTIVHLPTPEPQTGMIFFGWCDGLSYYTDEYEMPAHDVSMDELWTEDHYETNILSGTYELRSEYQTMIISESEMRSIKSKIDSGEIDALRMVINVYGNINEITLQKEDIIAIKGSLEVFVIPIHASQIPERQKVIGDGVLFDIELNDSNGTIEKTSKDVDVKVTLERLNSENTVTAYYMDNLGRLTELDCDYTFYTVQHVDEEGEIDEELRADVTIHTGNLPYCLTFTSFVPITGISLETLLISLIPVVVVGIILAIIRWRD